MERWTLRIIWLYSIWATGTGCQDGLRYESSPINASTLLSLTTSAETSLLHEIPVLHPFQCALMCYRTLICGSAIYRPHELLPYKQGEAYKSSPPKGGLCILLRFSPECDPDSGELVSSVLNYYTPVLMHCFICASTTTTKTSPEKETPLIYELRNISLASNNDPVNDLKETHHRTKRKATSLSLRVMTFNTFLSGSLVEKGLSKVAKHIEMYQPDIVFLQEVHDDWIGPLLDTLGRNRWRSCSRNSGPFNHIITRHRIVTEYEPVTGVWNNGCQVQLLPPDQEYVVNLWNLHLNPREYAPYRACSRNKPIQSVQDLLRCENERPANGNSRVREMQILSEYPPFLDLVRQAKGSGPPLIVAGDFNSPSHLDWTDSAKQLHCQWSCEWPVSKVMDKLGFIDSYRSAQQDPYDHPGATWSTIYKDSTEEKFNGQPIPEPQDRIDIIYYISDHLKVFESFVYAGQERISYFPNFFYNDWPSDHASVISTFTWDSPKLS